MTVHELGEARPGNYTASSGTRNVTDARTADRLTLAQFTGQLLVDDGVHVECAFPFFEGKRTRFLAPPEIPARLLAHIPQGMSAASAVATLPKSYAVRLQDLLPGYQNYRLPADASKLGRFSGVLSGSEMTGWFHFYNWDVTFRNGVATGVEETEWDD